MIITGDRLYPDGSFIKRLNQEDYRFILVVKERNHKALFEEFRALPQQQHEIQAEKITHCFHWAKGHVLNKTHTDCQVNVLEYWENPHTVWEKCRAVLTYENNWIN